MSFQNLNIKGNYDSDEDDILNEFYVPVLSEAYYYDRLAGFFSSTSFALSAKGIANFIQKGGKMRLVTCTQLSANDLKAIQEGLTKPEEVISKIMIDDIDNIVDEFQQNHVSALSWMIANGNLEIKIAIPTKNDGTFADDTLEQNSIYHQKVGVLWDEQKKNVVSFSGSVNETGKAWIDNIEEFKVFCNWKIGQDEYCASDARKFEKFWNGQARNTKIFDLPEAVEKHLIKLAPKSITELSSKLQGYSKSPSSRLYDYQNRAVQAWFDSEMRGIIEMATGTGKTWVAIACLKKTLEKLSNEKLLIVISCPYTHLITQWEKNLRQWNLDSKPAFGQSSEWLRELGNDVIDMNNDIIQNLIILTTHDTFSSENFINLVKTSTAKKLLIVDEAHAVGSEIRRNGLLPDYDYRIALSATPKRYFDDAGTLAIFNFFGDVVFDFPLKDAIPRFLTPYYFYPHFVTMSTEEMNEYKEYSKRLAIQYSQNKDTFNEFGKLLAIKRQKIVKNASNKLNQLRDIIEKEKLEHCLIYCTENQMESVSQILVEHSIIYHRFTTHENNDERKELLMGFDKGDYDTLLAIKCLDQGVDVPSTRTAIILASTGNPVEFIQRRGRILRKYPGKNFAVIHDIIVVPPTVEDDEEYADTEKNILRKEFSRLGEFAGLSENPENSITEIESLMSTYDL